VKFRILILKDPHAEVRGFNLKGIKVPLRDWCPVNWEEDVATFDGKRLHRGPYQKFWRLSCADLIRSRPMLERFLKRIDHLLVPTEFCDVAPIERADEAWF
jgi:hypothetical protein